MQFTLSFSLFIYVVNEKYGCPKNVLFELLYKGPPPPLKLYEKSLSENKNCVTPERTSLGFDFPFTTDIMNSSAFVHAFWLLFAALLQGKTGSPRITKTRCGPELVIDCSATRESPLILDASQFSRSCSNSEIEAGVVPVIVKLMSCVSPPLNVTFCASNGRRHSSPATPFAAVALICAEKFDRTATHHYTGSSQPLR